MRKLRKTVFWACLTFDFRLTFGLAIYLGMASHITLIFVIGCGVGTQSEHCVWFCSLVIVSLRWKSPRSFFRACNFVGRWLWWFFLEWPSEWGSRLLLHVLWVWIPNAFP